MYVCCEAAVRLPAGVPVSHTFQICNGYSVVKRQKTSMALFCCFVVSYSEDKTKISHWPICSLCVLSLFFCRYENVEDEGCRAWETFQWQHPSHFFLSKLNSSPSFKSHLISIVHSVPNFFCEPLKLSQPSRIKLLFLNLDVYLAILLLWIPFLLFFFYSSYI